MEATLSQLLEKGTVNLTSDDVKRYNSDCDSLLKEMGTLVIKDLQEQNLSIKEKKYMIVFFPVGRENLINLAKRTDLTYQGQELVAPFFVINYDKNLQFKDFQKRQPNIPTSLTYMILAY